MNSVKYKLHWYPESVEGNENSNQLGRFKFLSLNFCLSVAAWSRYQTSNFCFCLETVSMAEARLGSKLAIQRRFWCSRVLIGSNGGFYVELQFKQLIEWWPSDSLSGPQKCDEIRCDNLDSLKMNSQRWPLPSNRFQPNKIWQTSSKITSKTGSANWVGKVLFAGWNSIEWKPRSRSEVWNCKPCNRRRDKVGKFYWGLAGRAIRISCASPTAARVHERGSALAASLAAS